MYRRLIWRFWFWWWNRHHEPTAEEVFIDLEKGLPKLALAMEALAKGAAEATEAVDAFLVEAEKWKRMLEETGGDQAA